MIANRIKSLALAATFATAVAPMSFAGGDAGRYHSGHHHHHTRADLKQLSDRTLGGASRIVSGTHNRGSIARPGAYFSGSTYVYSGGDRVVFIDRVDDLANNRDEQRYIAPKAKIINVTRDVTDSSFAPVNGCSYEEGVCVIRGH